MKTPIRKLEKAIHDAVAKNSRGLSERECLEICLAVAEEWKMRLDELEGEKEL